MGIGKDTGICRDQIQVMRAGRGHYVLIDRFF